MLQNQASGVDPAKTAGDLVSQHPDAVKSWMAWPPNPAGSGKQRVARAQARRRRLGDNGA